MAVGDILNSQVPVEVLSPDARSMKNHGEVEMRIEINNHFDNCKRYAKRLWRAQ